MADRSRRVQMVGAVHAEQLTLVSSVRIVAEESLKVYHSIDAINVDGSLKIRQNLQDFALNAGIRLIQVILYKAS